MLRVIQVITIIIVVVVFSTTKVVQKFCNTGFLLPNSKDMLIGYQMDVFFFSPGATPPIVGVCFTALCQALAPSRTRLLDRIQRRATVGNVVHR